MRRPLLLFCFAQALGILLGLYTSIRPVALTAASAASAALFLCAPLISGRKRKERAADLVYGAEGAGGGTEEPGKGAADLSFQALMGRRRAVCIVLCLFFVLAGFGRVRSEEAKISVLAPYEGQDARGRGTVTSCRVKNGYSQLIVRLAECAGPGEEPGRADEKLLLRLDETDPGAVFSLAGREIAFSGRVSLPDGRRNPGCFDYRLYLKGRGVRAVVSAAAGGYEAGAVRNVPLNFISSLKGRFLVRAEPLLGEDAFGVVSGLMFGEKGFLEDSAYEQFKHNGIAHVLAVSGLHVGLLYALIMKLTGGRRDLRTSLAALVLLLIYAALADFSVSVLRASLMIALNMLAFHLRRRYDMVSAASLTALIFTLIDPYQLLDSGFQLSFTAAYSLGIVLPWMQARVVRLSDEKKSDLIFYAGSLAAPCLAVHLGMLPLTLFHFLCWSPLSLLINPAAIALAGLILPAGLAMFAFFILAASFEALGGAFGMISLPARLLFAGAAGPARALSSALLGLASLAEKAGEALLGSFDAPAPPLGLMALYYALFFWYFSETRYILRRKRRTGPLCAVLILLIASSCVLPKALGVSADFIPWSYGRAPFTFLDVGQGDCLHLHSQGFDALVDGGGRRGKDMAEDVLVPYLLKQGVRRIDLCVVTHLDEDHCLGLEQLSRRMDIGCFAFPAACEGDERLKGFISERQIFLSRGDMLELGEGAVLSVLSPPGGRPKSPDDNDDCLVIMAEAEGVRALLTGDATAYTEAELSSLYGAELRADILKASHHGSAYSNSEAFVRAADPAFFVISCGRGNSYGHPADRVIDLLRKNSIIYGRTDECGALIIRRSPKGLYAVNAAGDRTWQIR